MRIVIVLLASLWLSVAPSAAAAQERAAPDARGLALADQYLELTMGAGLRKFMASYYEKFYAEAEMPRDQRDWWAENLTSAMDRVLVAMTADLRDDVAEIYTAEELQTLIALYRSPMGRSIAEKDLEMSVRMQEAMEPHMATLVEDLLAKYCLQFDCSAMADAAAKPGQ